MINIFVFFTQPFKNKCLTPVRHVLFIFLFSYFYVEILKCTFIERYQIIPVCMFTIICIPYFTNYRLNPQVDEILFIYYI